MRISVKAIICYKNKFLLLKPRKLEGSINGWDGPGGTMEDGETMEQTLDREVFEETGIKIQNRFHLQTLEIPNIPVRYEIYFCTSDTDQVALSEEHVEYKWASAEEFSQLTKMDLVSLLNNFKNKF